MLPQLKQELAYVDDGQLQMGQAAKTHQRQLSGSDDEKALPEDAAAHPDTSKQQDRSGLAEYADAPSRTGGSQGRGPGESKKVSAEADAKQSPSNNNEQNQDGSGNGDPRTNQPLLTDAGHDGGSPGVVKGGQMMHGSPGRLAAQNEMDEYGATQGGPAVVRGLLSDSASAQRDNTASASGNPTGQSTAQATLTNMMGSQQMASRAETH